jgi:tripartite-type tricarboxylate transporter receptor subunit TctC
MTLSRRRVLQTTAAVAAFPRLAAAQTYPSRPIHLVVGFPAGSSTDISARIMGPWLAERLGQPVVIENKPGAGTNIAAQAVVSAPPDGATLLWMTTANASNVSLYPALAFNLLRDITPVAGVVSLPMVLEINPSLPAKTIGEFIDYAKANAGKINLASNGVGSVSHLAGELFKAMTGTSMTHVPYRGSPPALADLIGGQVQAMVDAVPASLPHIRSGKLRALAVTTAVRSHVLPDVPSIGESVPGYDASVWIGIGAPKDTPPAIVERVNAEVNAGLTNPGIKARYAELGNTTMPLTPAQYGAFMAAETAKWAKVVRDANIRIEP